MHWPTATLGDIARWGSGGTPKRSEMSYFGAGTPWLSIADLNDGLVSGAKESLTPEGIAHSSAKVVPPGTIFVAMYGSIGKLGLAATYLCTSQAIAFAVPDDALVEARYLFHFLLAERSKLVALGRGGTQMNIGQADLKNWPIPLPPIEEQQRIADILNRADALRVKRCEALAFLNDLTQSIFLDMFGQLESAVEFGSLITSGPTNGLYRPSSDYGSGTPILRIDGFDLGEVKPSDWKRLQVSPSDLDRYSLAEGDIVINRVNALSHLGKSALIARLDEPAVFESNMMRIRLDRDQAEPRYVIAWLQTPSVKQQILARAKKSINQASINQSDVRSLTVPLAPRSRQVEFAQRIQRVAAQRDAVRRALEADSELFAALQQRAFAGLL